MADLSYIYQNVSKISCVFSKPYENYFNWSMPTVEQIWRISIFEKETSKSNMTVSNNSVNIEHFFWAWN